MGKPKGKTTSILETKHILKSSMGSHSQMLKENRKNRKQMKKAVKNIDLVKNGEYVRLSPEATSAKASKNWSSQLFSKTIKDNVKDPFGTSKNIKPSSLPCPKFASEVASDISGKKIKKLTKHNSKRNQVVPELPPATRSEYIVPPSAILNVYSTKFDKNEKRHSGGIGEQCAKKNEATFIENRKCLTKKMKSYSTPSRVNRSTILKAVSAIKQLSTAATDKKILFDNDAPIFLQFTMVKIPNKSVNTAFALPHSLVSATSEVCLITPDLSKGYKKDHESTIESWNDKLKAANVTKVNTVLPFRQLRVEYDQFELKRRLFTQHDFILVDSRLLSHAAHLLGKMFSNVHNKFIPVRIYGRDIKKSIDKALQTTFLKVKESATALISVAHNEMSVDEIADNIESVLTQLEERFPGGEGNIRALHIKLPTSPAVPIYITLKPKFTVGVPKVITQQPKAYRDFEDELSTYSGDVKVKVMPEGRVLVTREKLQQCDLDKEVGGKKKQKLVEKQDCCLEDSEDLLDVAGEDQGTNEEENESDDE